MDRIIGGSSADFKELSIKNFRSDYEGINNNVIGLIWGIDQARSNNRNNTLVEFFNHYIPMYNVSYYKFVGQYKQLFADPDINSSMTKLEGLRTQLDLAIKKAQEHLFRSTRVGASGAAGSLLGKSALDFDREADRLCRAIDRMICEITIVPGKTDQKTLETMLDESSSWITTEYERFYHTFKELFSDFEKNHQFESIKQKKEEFFYRAGEAKLWLETINIIPSPEDPSVTARLPLRRPRLFTMDDREDIESPLLESPLPSSSSASVNGRFEASKTVSSRPLPQTGDQRPQQVKKDAADSLFRIRELSQDPIVVKLGEALATIPGSGKLTRSQIMEFQKIFSSDLYVEYTYRVPPGKITSLTPKIDNAYYWASQ